MKYLLHFLGVVFVVISTIVGVFLIPFLIWLFLCKEIWLFPFILSILSLIGTILWLIIKRKGNNKSIQFILLYLSLAILTPNTIALLRFDGEPERVCNCFYVYGWNRLYTKFGILKSDWRDEYRVASDLYGNRYIVAIRETKYAYSIEILDSYGEYVETIPVNEKSEINNSLRYHGYQ